MSLLGAYSKQPVEVEIYSIQFAKDLALTDEIQGAWGIISRELTTAWNQVEQTIPYTLQATDAEQIIVTSASVTLPTTFAAGYRVTIANKSQSLGISVGAFYIPARGSAVLVYSGTDWSIEAKTECILVNALNDQRVRTRVFSGTPWETYKVQVTVDTAEGRTLQDEFTVYIEEV